MKNAIRSHKPCVRWMRPCEVDELAQLDRQCFGSAWDINDLLAFAWSDKGCVYVAVYDGQLVGHLVCEYHKRWTEVVRVAVHPSWRRAGFGRELLKTVSPEKGCKRTYSAISVTDEYLPHAHKWLLACGWRMGGYIREGDVYVTRFESAIEKAVIV